MTATRPRGPTDAASQLDKTAIRRTPESTPGMPLCHYAALAYIAEQEGMAQQGPCEMIAPARGGRRSRMRW